MTITPRCQERFDSLNEQQRRALYTSPNSVLQVVAGPGTGKTHLITCRVAHLLTEYQLDPRKLIVTTFTKKAASEMKERLCELLEGDANVELDALFIGTFHSICLKFLRIHGDKIGVESFTIADETDQNELFKKAMEDAGVESKDQKDFKKGYLSYISKQKALGLLPNECRPKANSDKQQFETIANRIYDLYQEYLKINEKMDFDDILLYTYKLFDRFPECTSFVQHVLIDEFQDTNTIQLKLLYQLVKNCNDNVTVVGDADQSIYGFRNAEYSNFECMESEFKNNSRNIIKIVLDQNYRSTERILNAAEQLMRHQHQKREPKQLKSQSKLKIPIILTQFEEERHETDNIAALIAKYMEKGIEGTSCNYNDFAIVCRMRKTFRMTEMSLLHSGIPYVIVKGTSFWEMKEIKMVTDILRCVVSDYDWLSFKRILVWYVDNLGPTCVGNIENIIFERLQKGEEDVNVLNILKDVASDQEKIRATAKAKKNLSKFLERLETFRRLSKIDEERLDFDVPTRRKLFNNVIVGFSVIEIATKLKTTKDKDPEPVARDIESNVHEFRNQFCQFNPLEDEVLMKEQRKLFKQNDESFGSIKNWRSFLSLFLDEIYIYSTLQTNEEEENTAKPRVTICTIHASKGLEWPVVFIPSLVDGTFPISSNDSDLSEEAINAQEDEERRCFYVAITRGKYIVHLSTRSSESGYFSVVPSKFLDEIGSDILTDEPIVEPRVFEKVTSNPFSGTDFGFITALDEFNSNPEKEIKSTIKLKDHTPIKIEDLFQDEKGENESISMNQEHDDTFSDGDTAILKHADDTFSDDDEDVALFINQLNRITETSKAQVEKRVEILVSSSPLASPQKLNTLKLTEQIELKASGNKTTRADTTANIEDKTKKKTKGKGKTTGKDTTKKRKPKAQISLNSDGETSIEKAKSANKKSKGNIKTIRPMYPSIDHFFTTKSSENDTKKKRLGKCLEISDDEIDMDQIFS